MLVAKYVEKFEGMDAYSKQVAYALDELWKIDKLLFGLRENIIHDVTQREFTTYVECLRQWYIFGRSDGLDHDLEGRAVLQDHRTIVVIDPVKTGVTRPFHWSDQ